MKSKVNRERKVDKIMIPIKIHFFHLFIFLFLISLRQKMFESDDKSADDIFLISFLIRLPLTNSIKCFYD